MSERWGLKTAVAAVLFGLYGCGEEAALHVAANADRAVIGKDRNTSTVVASVPADAPGRSTAVSGGVADAQRYGDPETDRLAAYNPPVYSDPDPLGAAGYKQALDCLIEPSEVSDVATSISGVLEEVLADRGDQVSKGQVIARLRSNVEKANVDLARAELKFRERNYRRWEEMHEQSYASNVERDEAENRREIARFQLERAEQILEERVIRSPFDGVVVAQYLSAGELSEDRKIFKLVRIDLLNVEVIAPVDLLGRVHKGMEAKVYPEGPVEGPFSASVTVVDPIVDAASGTLGMRLSLPNSDYAIPAGVKCRIEFDNPDL